MVPGVTGNRDSRQVGQVGRRIVDEHERDMEAFVMQNPQLAGRAYYNVPRGAYFEAPPVRAVALGWEARG